MKTIRKDRLRDIVFLLGAGASVDAGLPTVAELTRDLRKQLPTLPGPDGVIRPEFVQLFDLIQTYDSSVAKNYERFFEWINLLLNVQKEPFRKLICTDIPNSLIDVISDLNSVVGEELFRLLELRQGSADYLKRLADFVPEKGRLKVFTLNYDCCLEDACRIADIDLTTGFDPIKRKWKPSLFLSKSNGINLYKLHGSLRWNSTRDSRLSGDRFQYSYVPAELRPEERSSFPTYIEVSPGGWLVLGPGNKIQADDPFITLFYEFHRSLPRAKVCVVIGYSYQDFHINTVLDRGIDRGVSIVDVNPGGPCGRYLASNHYRYLRMPAKDALINGNIRSEIERLKL